MTWSIPDEVASVLRSAEKHRLAPPADGAPVLDRAGIEALVPHRGDALLLDRVTALDALRGTLIFRSFMDRETTSTISRESAPKSLMLSVSLMSIPLAPSTISWMLDFTTANISSRVTRLSLIDLPRS